MIKTAMADHDESLEVGIAAGLDVPTAMVLSEQDEKPRRSPGCGSVAVWLVVIALVIFLYAIH